MYTSHTILDFNFIYIFHLFFKRSPTSFCIFFLIINNNIVNMIYIILIYLRLNFSCASASSLTLIFYHRGISFTEWLTISLYFFLGVKFISSFRIVPVVLIRPAFRILRTKVTQDLELIWRMHKAMDNKSVFGSNPMTIYIPFSVLDSTITHLGVSIWRFGFSSHFPDVTRMIVTCPSSF